MCVCNRVYGCGGWACACMCIKAVQAAVLVVLSWVVKPAAKQSARFAVLVLVVSAVLAVVLVVAVAVTIVILPISTKIRVPNALRTAKSASSSQWREDSNQYSVTSTRNLTWTRTRRRPRTSKDMAHASYIICCFMWALLCSSLGHKHPQLT